MLKDNKTKFKEIYSYIKKNIHFCNNDFLLKKERYNTAILTGMLTSLVNGKMIYVGEYGQGKTTLSEVISSLMFSTPPLAVTSSSLKGHPELTNEQIVGRIDLGAYSKGIEKTIWSDFVFSKTKIVDELNRIPEHKQNILLTGMQNDIWKNLNESMDGEGGPWFATMNYKDRGNNGIIPPLLDRFDISVEAKSPGVNNSRLILFSEKINFEYEDINNAYSKLISLKDLTKERYKTEMNTLQEEFRLRTIRDKGLHLLTKKEFAEIQNEIKNVKIGIDAIYFRDVIEAELSTCQQYGQKRATDNCPEDCHFTNYACYNTKNSLSVRTTQSIKKYSKALAWLDGSKEVTPNHIQSILPLAIWHKINFTDDYISTFEQKIRTEPANLEASIATINEIKKRANQILPAQKEFTKYMLSGNIKAAKTKANQMDHPVFAEYLK